MAAINIGSVNTEEYAILSGSENPVEFSRQILDEKIASSIPLVTYCGQKDEMIVANPQAVDLLRTIHKPVALIGICGPYRSGKSYFGSKFMRSKDEFKVSNKLDPCTKGIWMSTSVLKSKEFAVLFLDTEGLGSPHASDDEASSDGEVMKYLIITTLLCSYLIYNTKGAITRNNLLEMSQFSELSKLVLISEPHDRDTYDYKKFFPNFLWLLRDCDMVTTDENDEDEEISMTDYIHKKILVTSTTKGKKSPSSRDKIVVAIQTMFPTIECQAIPHPGAGIKNPAKPVDVDFTNSLNACIDFILCNIKPKQGFNTATPLNGQMLASLLEVYVEVLNKPGGVPNLEKSFQTAADTTLQHEIIQSSQIYWNKMDKTLEPMLPVEVGDVEVLKYSHQCLMDEALTGNFQAQDVTIASDHKTQTLFEQHLAAYSHILEKFSVEVHKWIPSAVLRLQAQALNIQKQRRENFLQQFQEKFIKMEDENIAGGLIHHYIKQNQNKSEQICKSRVQSLYEAQKQAGIISLTKLMAEYNSDRQVKGPAKETVLVTFISQVPGPPQNLCMLSNDDQSLNISWKKPAKNAEAVESYHIHIWEGEIRRQKEVSNLLMYTIQGLNPVTEYKIRVQGVNGEKVGEYSNLLTAKTKAGKPSQPEKPNIIPQTATEGNLFIEMLPIEKQRGSPVTHVIVTRNKIHTNRKCKSDIFTLEVSSSAASGAQCHTVDITCKRDEQALEFKVQFKNEAGISEASKSCLLHQEEMFPGKPENVCVDRQVLKARELTIKWDSPAINPGAVQTYCIQCQVKPQVGANFPQSDFETLKQCFLISGLHPKTIYTIQICAKSKKQKISEYSDPLEIETLADVPDKPQIRSIKTTSSNNAILTVCKQSPTEENGSPVYAARVEHFLRDKNMWEYLQPEYPLTANQNNPDVHEIHINLVSLTEEVTTSYHVITKNEIGESEPSQQIDLPPDKVIPGEVNSFEASDVTDSTVTLQWKEPTMNPIVAKMYEVKYRNIKESNWFLTQRGSEKDPASEYLSIVVRDLKPNTVYEFSVKSLNGANPSQESLLKRKTLPSVPPIPRKPLLLPSGNKFTLKVFLPAVEESGREVEQLLINYFDEKSKNVINQPENTFNVGLQRIQEEIDGTRTYQQLLEIDIDRVYYINIQLINEIGPSKASEMTGVTTGDVTPGKPDDLHYEEDSRHVKLFWRTPKKNGNAAGMYQMFYQEDSSNKRQISENFSYRQIENSSPLSYAATISDLTPYTRYTFAVRGVNNVSKKQNRLGEYSEVVVVTKAACPEKPLPLKVLPVENEPLKANVSIFVLPEESINAAKLQTALIEFFDFETVDSDWVIVKEIELKPEDLSKQLKETITLHNLKNKTVTSYRFRTKMTNECGESAPSDECLLPVLFLQPGEPQNLAILDVTPHTIEIQWEIPKIHAGLVTGYTLECTNKYGKVMPIISLPFQTKQYQLKNLKSNENYTIKVSALGSSSNLPAVIEVSTPEVYPSAPIGLCIQKIGCKSIKIRWSKPTTNHNEVLFYYVELRKGDHTKAEATPSTTEQSQVGIPEAIQARQTKGYSSVFRGLDTFTQYTVSVGSYNDNKQKREGATSHIVFRTKMNPHSRRAAQVFSAPLTLGMGSVALQFTQAPDEDITTSDEEYHDPNALPSAPENVQMKSGKSGTSISIKWSKPKQNSDELHNKHPYYLEVRKGKWKNRLEQDPLQSSQMQSSDMSSTAIASTTSFFSSFRLDSDKMKHKVRNLEPDKFYTFSLSSYNYLPKKGGTVHIEHAINKSTKHSKPPPSVGPTFEPASATTEMEAFVGEPMKEN